MKTTIKVNGKKISKKKAVEDYGKERIEKRIQESIESYYEDPMELCTWMDGMEIVVTE